MNWRNCIRNVELTEEELKDRVCFCPETGNPNEFSDGSSLPCKQMDSDLPCSKCIYCIKSDTSINKYGVYGTYLRLL